MITPMENRDAALMRRRRKVKRGNFATSHCGTGFEPAEGKPFARGSLVGTYRNAIKEFFDDVKIAGKKAIASGSK